MSLPAKILSLAVVVAACTLTLLTLATPNALIAVAWFVIGIAAAGALALIAFLDLVARAARQVFGRVEDVPRS